MDRWDDLRYLVAVHKTGTMSGAARLLGANVGTVSRRIERLGEILGASPFVKTPQGWTSNPDMLPLIEAAITFENEIKSAMSSGQAGLGGGPVRLRLSCPPLVSTLMLFPHLCELRQRVPNVHLSIAHSIQSSSATLGDNDMIITPQRPDRGRLLTRGVGKIDVALYRFRGADETGGWIGLNEDLDGSQPMRLGYAHFGREPVLRVDNLSLVAEAMRASRLPGVLPVLLGDAAPELERIDPATPPEEIALWLCYHETRRGDRTLAAVMDWVLACFSSSRAG
ncbi:MAG: LysR family transcriptional regulator [Tranquillimonas sp.]